MFGYQNSIGIKRGVESGIASSGIAFWMTTSASSAKRFSGVGPRWNEESLSRLMANADANADGKLQLQEFVNWIFSSKDGEQ